MEIGLEMYADVGDRAIGAAIQRQVLRQEDSRYATDTQKVADNTTAGLNDSSCIELTKQTQSGSQYIAENDSLLDSAYVSLTPSMVTTGPQTDEKHSPRGGVKIENTDLFTFKKEVDRDTLNHFLEVRPHLERLLVKCIRKSWSKDSNPKVLAIRLMVLGRSEAETAPHIVIICPPNQCGRVQKFFNSPIVKKLCEPPRGSVSPLKCLVVGRAPQMTFADLGIDVRYNSTISTNKSTFCGVPILLINKSHSPSIEKRKATLGGIIKVTSEDGNSTFYGMTAGHVLQGWQDFTAYANEIDDTENSNDEETSEVDSIEPENKPTSQSALDTKEGTESWRFLNSASFGDILDNSRLPEVAAGKKCPSHDWALFRINSRKPNELCKLEYPGHYERRQLLIASRPKFNDELSDPVIMIGGSHGPKPGELSSLPGRLLIGPSEMFIDVYMLELNEGTVCNGDSGAWVVHNAAPEVYGHVVATDQFGDAYVIPLCDTFKNIQECMGAAAVELPNMEDFERADLDQAMFLPETETKTSFKTPGVDHFGITNVIEFSAAMRSDERNRYNPDYDATEWDTVWDSEPFSNHQNVKDDRSYTEHNRVIDVIEADSDDSGVDFQGCEGSAPEAGPYQTIVHPGERKYNSLNRTAKKWLPEFSTCRNFKEDTPYIKLKGGLGANSLIDFLQDYDDSVHSCKVEEIEEFCRGVCLDDLKLGRNTAGTQRVVWLDDRAHSCQARSGYARKYGNPLTATQFYQLLQLRRFNNAVMPDANRRLIYIENLNPYCILALAETASWHEVETLRDAIWKHIALQTSIRVQIPPHGFPVFQLEFHIPYFAFRASPSRNVRNGKPVRFWADLSFLDTQTRKLQNERKYGIYEAQISFAICGSDETNWVAYAFIDTDFDNEGLTDEENYDGIQQDRISADVLDANVPIWNPRVYFLEIFKIRISQVVREWEYLVRTVERSIKSRYRHLPTSSRGTITTRDQSEDVKEYFNWIIQTMNLLRHLLSQLSETVKAWERFNSSNGDIGYFSDLDVSGNMTQQVHVHLSLEVIRAAFETLGVLQQKLLLLEKSCENLALSSQMLLSMNSSEITQSNGVSIEFAITILAPIALAVAYFSMPQSTMPFKATSTSFFVSIFIIVAMVTLVFYIFRSLFRSSWWLKRTLVQITTELAKKGCEMAPSFSTSEYLGRFTIRRRRSHPSSLPTSEVQMHKLEV